MIGIDNQFIENHLAKVGPVTFMVLVAFVSLLEEDDIPTKLVTRTGLPQESIDTAMNRLEKMGYIQDGKLTSAFFGYTKDFSAIEFVD